MRSEASRFIVGNIRAIWKSFAQKISSAISRDLSVSMGGTWTYLTIYPIYLLYETGKKPRGKEKKIKIGDIRGGK